MAKTLIGNIKGKNGRGITSIKKTGTTGSVDTYTITYTDSTTSTFTVNNSDNISLQRQIVPSAAIESSATASQAYTAGDYVVVGGVLRKVTAAIAKGNAIGNSNSTATTVTGELATLGDSYASQPGSWIKHKRYTQITTQSGNIAFVGLEYGKFVILCAIADRDIVAIPYYQSPTNKLFGAHIIRDSNVYAAIVNTEVTVDVWYYEIPSV